MNAETKMTEKSEEQIAKERAAVEAMKNAKSNMDAALSRIDTLERAINYALDRMKANKQYVSGNVYTYFHSGQQKSVHTEMDEQIAHIRKLVG